ncbi:MAG: hypothetical protein QM820_07275 [Minicystis sp.]
MSASSSSASSGSSSSGGTGGGPVNGCGLPAPADVGAAKGLLDLGHVKSIGRLARSGDRVLSQDVYGRWNLWDAKSGNALATGTTDTFKFLGVAGDLAVVQTVTGILLYNAASGMLQTTLSIPASSMPNIGLATDGSYVWVTVGTTGHLQAFSPTGAQILDVAGGYGSAIVFATPSEIRVAGGPAGANKVETIPISGGASTISAPFNHAITQWTLDGERVLAVPAANTVFVYNKDATLVGGFTVPSITKLAGSGDYFWTFDYASYPYTLRIYDVKAGNTPVYTNSGSYTPNSSIAASRAGFVVANTTDATVDVVTLGPTLAFASRPVPLPFITELAIDDGGSFVAGNMGGGVYGVGSKADPQYEAPLGCGRVLASAGSTSGRVALSTASSRVFVFDVAGNAATPVEAAQMSPTPTSLALTSDGSLLGALGGPNYPLHNASPDMTLHLQQIPGLVETSSFPSARSFSLALSGARIGRTDGAPTPSRQVTDLSGNTVVWSDMGHAPSPLVSPNGMSFVVTDLPPDATPFVNTQFYNGSTLVNAVTGGAVGWIDDGRVLVQSYQYNNGPGDPVIYASSQIYSAQGALLASPALPKITGFDVVAPGKILSHDNGNIYDVQTGAVVWTNPVSGASPGVPAGGSVLFTYQDGVYLVPHN